MTPTEQLEERLRAALAARADDVRLPPDAWQRNQRRIAESRGRRTSRITLGAAAAVVLVLVLGITLLGGGRDSAPPAGQSSSDDAFATRFQLGPPVLAETLVVDGERAVHEIVLSDMTGEGPTLCDRFVAASSGGGSCTAREPGADDPAVAFDWLAGTSGTGDLRGVLGGVDERVDKVTLWMDDGARSQVDLQPTGWEDTRMFAVTVPATEAVPQRLAAVGRDGRLLQVVDVVERFGGDEWLPARRACGSEVRTGVWPIPGSGGPADVRVRLGTSDAEVSVTGQELQCLTPLAGSAIAGIASVGDLTVAVLGPEVDLVRVVDGERVLQERVVATSKGSPYSVFPVRGLDPATRARAELVALDVSLREVDRTFLAQPASP